MFLSKLKSIKEFAASNEDEEAFNLIETDASQAIEMDVIRATNSPTEMEIDLGSSEKENDSESRAKIKRFSSFFSRSKNLFPSQTPWNNKNGKPINDNLKIQLLYDITGYLMLYGAPLHRVQHRLKHAAELFQIPVTAFFLPSDLMISVGECTTFLSIPINLNMYKLERIDRLVQQALKLMEEKKKNVHSTSFPSHSSKLLEEKPILEIEQQLAEVVNDESNELSPFFLTICASFTCTCLIIVCFRGNFSEGVAAFCLGGLAFWLNLIASRYQLQLGSPIFVSFIVSLICGIWQYPIFWSWASSPGICAEYVIITSLMPNMPASQFALGMLEFTALPVASLVRFFLSFMRSFQIGYGMAMGLRLAESISVWYNISLNNSSVPSICPSSIELQHFDAWRLFFLPPMLVCIMILYRAHWTQSPVIFAATTACFTVSVLTKESMNPDLNILLSGLTLGMVANTLAKWTRRPAIPSIYCGIFWLLPGGLKMLGSAKLIAESSGADYGLNIMLRTLSMSIGLYSANILVFMFSKRTQAQDETLTV